MILTSGWSGLALTSLRGGGSPCPEPRGAGSGRRLVNANEELMRCLVHLINIQEGAGAAAEWRVCERGRALLGDSSLILMRDAHGPCGLMNMNERVCVAAH